MLSSYSIEFVRNGVEISHNLFDFDVRKDEGNLISAFGNAAAKGHSSFHNNLVSNPGRGVVWINEIFNNLEIRNNHIITRTTATPRTDGLFGFNSGGDFKTISIWDNVIECQGQTRPLLRCKESYGAVIRNNELTNVSDTDRYDNPRTDRRAGLETPLKFECGVHGEFTVDGWQARPMANSADLRGPATQPPSAQSFQWPHGKKAALSLSFDDARFTQADVGLALLQQYGVKATFYVSLDRLPQRLPAWQEAVKAGHEIGNHSLKHAGSGNFDWARSNPLESYTLERMRQELIEANRQIHDALGVTPVSFAYPCGMKFVGRGESTQSFVPLIASLFESGRGYMDEGYNAPGYCDPAQLMGIPSDGHTFQETQGMIEQAMRTGGWIILAGHEIGDTPGATQVSFLKELLAYVQDPAHPIWVDTVGSVAAYLKTHSAQAEYKNQSIK
jgi:peptidoglycan/xylan/chitin deacetylase (PgdA/CDA1 family)